MISFKHKGSFADTFSFFGSVLSLEAITRLHEYAQKGVHALSKNTPVEYGTTASSWGYEIKAGKRGTSIIWTNSHMGGNTPVAILLQYGHATGTGGYVQGRDFINPAIQPIFDQIAEDVFREVNAN